MGITGEEVEVEAKTLNPNLTHPGVEAEEEVVAEEALERSVVVDSDVVDTDPSHLSKIRLL